jgi:hypothetical protein
MRCRCQQIQWHHGRGLGLQQVLLWLHLGLLLLWLHPGLLQL